MAYIGNTVQNQGFSPAVDYFNGDGTTVTFTLSRPVASVAQLTAVIENVIQNPSTAFTVSGNSITFTSAPPAGTSNIWVEYTSLVTTYAAISQDPSVIGDITATGGYLSTGDFGNSYIDGTIVDYVTGMARITTGPSDGITLYNGGTSARTALMTLSAAGNVGIGTSSPSAKLHVSGTSDELLRLDSTDVNPYLNFRVSGTRKAYMQFASASGVLIDSEAASTGVLLATQGTVRLNIDASGRVTTPYQPAFVACGAATSVVTSAGNPIAFSSLVSSMVGSTRSGGYNTGTYRYTAPVAGLYEFKLIYYALSGGYAQIAPYKNGAIITSTDQFLVAATVGTDTAMTSGSFLIELAVNDYIDIRPRSGGNSTNMFGGHSAFMGYLIG